VIIQKIRDGGANTGRRSNAVKGEVLMKTPESMPKGGLVHSSYLTGRTRAIKYIKRVTLYAPVTLWTDT